MKKSLNAILIAVDFEKASLAAVQQSYNIARQLQLDIHLLYVHEDGGVLKRFFSHEQTIELIARLSADMSALAAKTGKESGMKVVTHVTGGRITQKVNEMAEQIGARYIFIGASNSAAAPVGGHAIRIIRSAQVPVFTIKADQANQNRCRCILLPLDLTAETRQKVSAAIGIAKVYNATIRIISGVCSSTKAEDINHLNIQFRQVKNFIEKEGARCTGEMLTCPQGQTSHVKMILDYIADHNDIDLIVITTQAESEFIEFFIDSEATQLIRQAPVPVMSVVPKSLGSSGIRSF
jgi:nucleotide-binding universal stress UspA family protein